MISVSALFSQAKYITAGDSILTFTNPVYTTATSVYVFVSDSSNSIVDTLVAEVKNKYSGAWSVVGLIRVFDNTLVSSIIPGDGVNRIYKLLYPDVNTGDVRVRRTNVTSRTQRTYSTIERKNVF